MARICGEVVGGVVRDVAKGEANDTEGVFEEEEEVVVSVLHAEEELDDVALS